MGFIRFLIWTSMCIGLGVFVASYEVDGRTPVQHLKQIWKSSPHSASVAQQVEGTLDKGKKAINSVRDVAPSEQHTDSDKDALNKLVARRATSK